MRLPLPCLAALFIVAIGLGRPSTAFAWGIEGHLIVARIAEERLTPQARLAIAKLLGQDAPALHDPKISSWADFIGKERPETKPWHYIDIPTDKASFDPDRDAPEHHSVLDQIVRFRAALADRELIDQQKTEALKFLVHFVGDMHQPLHTTARYDANGKNDRGGNNVQVIYFGENANLHRIWDINIVVRMLAGKSAVDFADDLNQEITDKEADAWTQGTIEDWINESHKLAVEVVYQGVPQSKDPVTLGEDYQKAAEPVVRLQFKRAGVRLAFLLNSAFDGK